MLTAVVSGQRTHTCLFLSMPVRVPRIFYNGSMPNNILKVKVMKADNVPTLVKRAGCLWQRSGSAVGRLGPSDWSSRRFSGWHTTPVQRLSSSAGRAWGLRASSRRGRCERVLGVSWQLCLNYASRSGTPSCWLGLGQLSTRAFPPRQQ